MTPPIKGVVAVQSWRL